MTPYCEITRQSGENKLYALQDITHNQLGFLADLLNSVNSPLAEPLRKAVNTSLRETNPFILEIEKNIKVCSHCQGAEKIVVGIPFSNETKKEICEKCRGQGRIVEVTSRRIEPLNPEMKSDMISGPPVHPLRGRV